MHTSKQQGCKRTLLHNLKMQINPRNQSSQWSLQVLISHQGGYFLFINKEKVSFKPVTQILAPNIFKAVLVLSISFLLHFSGPS